MPNQTGRSSLCWPCPSKDGLKPDPEKIRAVEEMQPPQNTKELKIFFRFTQDLANFMPNMASVSYR